MCLLLCYRCIICYCQNGVNEGESPVCFVVSRNKITDYTNQPGFGTWKVYCVSNVTFHAEFKYSIKRFPSPTVFVQWYFLLLIFRNFRYFCQWYYYTWTNILNSFQQRMVTYNLPLSNHLLYVLRNRKWQKKKSFVMALDFLLRHTEWRFINTPVLHRHSLCMHPVEFHFVLSTV